MLHCEIFIDILNFCSRGLYFPLDLSPRHTNRALSVLEDLTNRALSVLEDVLRVLGCLLRLAPDLDQRAEEKCRRLGEGEEDHRGDYLADSLCGVRAPGTVPLGRGVRGEERQLQ